MFGSKGWSPVTGPEFAAALARRLWQLAAVSVVVALSACTPHGPTRDRPHQTASQPGFPRLGGATPAGDTTFSNDSLADLFVHLTHDLEWGARRPHLLRYEAPVRVGLSGQGSAQYEEFLDTFLHELREQTGIDIARSSGPRNMSIRFVPGAAFRARIPQHFCVVAPGELDWPTFRSDPAKYGTRAFEIARKLNAMTVFIPDNAEPWLVRICLIEEITQGLGPANDLYGLGPSIFNDDAAHVWPTALDYLMLRVLYQPEMRTGLNRRETKVRARRVLQRFNPRGSSAPPLPPLRIRQMRDWAETLKKAFDQDRSRKARLDSARAAIRMAASRAPGSVQHCHSLTVLSRVIREPIKSKLSALERAIGVCTAAHGSSDIRITKLLLEKARATHRSGRPGAAFGISEPLAARLAAHGQEERLVALYALQAASLRAIQQSTKSFTARRRAGEWGAYALGRDHPDVLRLLSN